VIVTVSLRLDLAYLERCLRSCRQRYKEMRRVGPGEHSPRLPGHDRLFGRLLVAVSPGYRQDFALVQSLIDLRSATS